MAKVQIYTTPACIYCKMAKEFFAKNKIEYTEYDVSEDHKKAEEMMKKSGQMGVPVLDIEGKIIVGFDKEAIKEAVGL